jgi:hypothetical protein
VPKTARRSGFLRRQARAIIAGDLLTATTPTEGFFAFMWFGWGQAEAPSWLSLPLLVGSCLGAIVALVGGVVAVRATGQRTAMAEREIRLRYNVIVGVHFLPLARVFPGLFLVPLAWALVAIATSALELALATTTSPSTVTGPGAGSCLIAAAVATLLAASADRQGTITGSVLPSPTPKWSRP